MTAKNAFLFSGQGSQYYQMGKPLYDDHEVFREWMQRLDREVRGLSGARVVESIYSGHRSEEFNLTRITHPAIFMVEYALARTLIEAGVLPQVVVGASLGTFAAAAVAGAMTPEDALAAVVAQADAIEASCEPGGMIAILAHAALYEDPFLSRHGELAGLNFDGHFAVAAPKAALGPMEAELRQRGIACQRLAVSYAFHSRWIDPARERFLSAVRHLPTASPHTRLVCCAHAGPLAALPTEHCWTVARQPIRFADTLAWLEQDGPFRYIDAGPSGTMANFAKYGLGGHSRSTTHPIMTPYGRDAARLAELTAIGSAATAATTAPSHGDSRTRC